MVQAVFQGGDDDRALRHIEELLEATEGQELRIASAYISSDGIAMIDNARDANGIRRVRLVTGVNQYYNPPNAFRAALDAGWDVSANEDETRLFHPKLLLRTARSEQPTLGMVGSANVTKAGLTRNFECGLITTDQELLGPLADVWNAYRDDARKVTSRWIDRYTESFAVRARARPAAAYVPLGVVDEPELTFGGLKRIRRATPRIDHAIPAASARMAWAGAESFTGQHAFQIEFPRDAARVLRRIVAPRDRDGYASFICADGVKRQMMAAYYEHNGMFRVNIPNATPGVERARRDKDGIVLVWRDRRGIHVELLPPGPATDDIVQRSVALNCWGRTTTRMYGWA